MLVSLRLKLAGRFGARSGKPDAERSRDNSATPATISAAARMKHRLSALLEFFFEFAPEFGIE